MNRISIVLERPGCADQVKEALQQANTPFKRTRHQDGSATFRIPARGAAHDIVLKASGLLHVGFACAQCAQTIRREKDGRSTYCASMHNRCFAAHAKTCGACATET